MEEFVCLDSGVLHFPKQPLVEDVSADLEREGGEGVRMSERLCGLCYATAQQQCEIQMER